MPEEDNDYTFTHRWGWEGPYVPLILLCALILGTVVYMFTLAGCTTPRKVDSNAVAALDSEIQITNEEALINAPWSGVDVAIIHSQEADEHRLVKVIAK